MHWESEADERARKILADHAVDLSEEAERVARRLRAGSVSADYVEEAAFNVLIRRPAGAWADLLLAVGIGMLGVAGGVLAVVLTTPSDAHPKLGWVGPASIAVACIGFLMAGIGGTLKVKSG
jgi:hypothetical protein